MFFEKCAFLFPLCFSTFFPSYCIHLSFLALFIPWEDLVTQSVMATTFHFWCCMFDSDTVPLPFLFTFSSVCYIPNFINLFPFSLSIHSLLSNRITLSFLSFLSLPSCNPIRYVFLQSLSISVKLLEIFFRIYEEVSVWLLPTPKRNQSSIY